MGRRHAVRFVKPNIENKRGHVRKFQTTIEINIRQRPENINKNGRRKTKIVEKLKDIAEQ